MGACESSNGKSVGKYVMNLPQTEINKIATRIVTTMRKKIPNVNDNASFNFLQDFDLTTMLNQNVSNVERVLEAVVEMFPTKQYIIVTWRDRQFPCDMPPHKKPQIFEILVFNRDLSRSCL